MSKSVSPLAPKSYPVLPALDGVRIATAEAGIRYKNRPTCFTCRSPGDRGGGRLHAVQMPVGAGGLVPQKSRPNGGPGRWW